MKSNAHTFRAAAEYLTEYGWLQGDEGLDGLPRCALGALASATRQLGLTTLRSVARLAAERATGAAHQQMLALWNDAPERRVQDVIALFDGLAYDEELREAIYRLRDEADGMRSVDGYSCERTSHSSGKKRLS